MAEGLPADEAVYRTRYEDIQRLGRSLAQEWVTDAKDFTPGRCAADLLALLRDERDQPG